MEFLPQKEARPLINPCRFSEPFLQKNIRQYYRLIKQKGLPLVISTNGLLLTRELTRFLVEIKLDAISFSIDALTDETMKKVRGVAVIDRINQNVLMMLETRGNLDYPRIGVSFVLSDENEHEKEDFINYWLQHVDVVRINPQFDEKSRVKNMIIPEKRVPCYTIYCKMVIDFKGDVLICTGDTFAKIKVGNVFKDGIYKVWHGLE